MSCSQVHGPHAVVGWLRIESCDRSICEREEFVEPYVSAGEYLWIYSLYFVVAFDFVATHLGKLLFMVLWVGLL